MPFRIPRSTPARALAATALVLLAACSGSDDADTDSDSTDPPPSAPTAPTAPSAPSVPTAETSAPANTDDDGGDDGSTADDLVTAFGANYAIFDDAEQNECVGRSLVDAIGLEAIEQAGVTADEVVGVIFLSDLGVSIEADAVPVAVTQLAECGDLAAIAIEGGSGTPEQTDCAAAVVTSELAAEQLLAEIAEIEPSADLQAARDALAACSAL